MLQAASGSDAIAVFGNHPGRVHAVLTDVIMPNMGGALVTDVLRKADPKLRVLFMSGYPAHEQILGHAITARTAFLQKPFTPAALARAVRQLLENEADQRTT